jgi:hypothetical protein
VRKQAVAMTLSSLMIVSAFMLTLTYHNPPAQSIPNFNVGLKLILKDADGRIAHTAYYPDDLILNNFQNFMQTWLTGTAVNTAATTTMTDDGGTSRTPTIWPLNSATNNYFTFNNAAQSGAEIGIGTSSTAPARADRALTTKVLAYVFVGNSAYDTVSQNVTVSATFTETGSATIQEAGLFVHWDYTSTTLADFMLFHDTFTGIAMTAGQTLTVQYIIPLKSTGFNNNFGYILASLLSSCTGTCAMSSINANFVVVDIRGVQENPNVYMTTAINPNTGNFAVGTAAATNGFVGTMAFSVGFSSTAGTDAVFQLFQPAYSGNNPLDSAVTNTLSANVLTLRGTITQTTLQTYQESGLYQFGSVIAGSNNNNGNNMILIWRGTYSAFTVSANNAFTTVLSLAF